MTPHPSPTQTGGSDRDVGRLRAVEQAARAYFMGYVQDEADERDCCIDDRQHELAQVLKLALDDAATPNPIEPRAGAKFQLGDRVAKNSGSSWHGIVVGTYSTTLTSEGYAVESEREPGSVQIYPAKALALFTDSNNLGRSDV